MSGSAPVVGVNMSCVSPLSTLRIASALPLYGTCVSWVAVLTRKCSAVRCPGAALPAGREGIDEADRLRRIVLRRRREGGKRKRENDDAGQLHPADVTARPPAS